MPTPLQIDYIDPDGNDWNLSDLSMSNGYICTGLAGIEGIPVEIQTVPLLDGTAYPALYAPQPGSIALGILVSDEGNENAYYALLDRVTRAFVNRRNEIPAPGYLVIQRPDGSSRQIAVYCTSGLNTPEVGLDNKTVFSLSLQTPDPYWSDLAPQELMFYGPSGTNGILPLLPIQLASSAVIGSATIANAGTAISYPTWRITGPGTPTFQNLTSGRKWSLNTAIPTGNVVQVTTKPGTQAAVNVTTATNIWDQLVLSSLRDLWGFVGGNNQINISMAGASASTLVDLTWIQRWSRA